MAHPGGCGKIDSKSLGEDKPSELVEKRDREPVFDVTSPKSKKRRLQEESVFTSSEEGVGLGVYQPKTKETRAAYEDDVLRVVQKQLGGHLPLEFVSKSADKVALLKNESIKISDLKKEVEKLLHPIPFPSRTFDKQADSADIGDAVVNADDDFDDDFGDDVDQENEEGEEKSYLLMVPEDEDEAAYKDMTLNVEDIDAYWFQRKLSKVFNHKLGPQQTQKLVEVVLKILAEGNNRNTKSKLFLHLHFELYELIHFLMRNRLKIVIYTRLARAENQDERRKIAEEVKQLGPDHAAVLLQLHDAAQGRGRKNLEKSIKEEDMHKP